jgi:hypothetical protein
MHNLHTYLHNQDWQNNTTLWNENHNMNEDQFSIIEWATSAGTRLSYNRKKITLAFLKKYFFPVILKAVVLSSYDKNFANNLQ